MRRLLYWLFLPTVLFARPHLVVEPQEGLIDEKVQITICECKPHSKVKVIAQMIDEKGREWKSVVTFASDAKGVVDLMHASPLEGSYSGVDPMGLFWSMELGKGEQDCTCFKHLSALPIDVQIAAELESGEVVRGKVRRLVAKEGLVRQTVSEEGVVGTYVCPQGQGPFPTVLVLGGAHGGIPPDSHLAQFANKGFAALGLAYFFAPHLPEHLQEVPVETIEKGIAWLKKQKVCDTSNLVLAGTSMGGVFGLLGASYYPQIKGVIVFDGAGVVFESLDSGKSLGEKTAPFSYQGKPLPFMPLEMPAPNEENFKTSFFLRTFVGTYVAQPKERREEAQVKVERINGPILLLGSLDDQLFASGYFLHQVYNRLIEHKFPYFFDFIAYKGTGHMLGVCSLPYVPTTSSYLKLRQNKLLIDVGGNAKDSATAHIDAWQRTFSFLQKLTQQG